MSVKSSMLSICEPESKSEDLIEDFHRLHLNIRDCSTQIDFEKFKFLVLDLLSSEPYFSQSDKVLEFVEKIKLLTSSSDILIFLKTHGFVSYFNYRLLARIIRLLWKDDQRIMSQLNDYIKKCKEFEQELSPSQLEIISRKELHPIVPSGLPEFRLKGNDTDACHWSNYLDRLPWSDYILLKSAIPGSIIMTYVALPCIVPDVLKDLTDPVILQELESLGVTVDFLQKPTPISEV